jgi:transcriptional regulator with XRE-family HTH domain
VKKIIEQTEILNKLQAAVDKAGSQLAFAKQHEINSGFISNILLGERNPSKSVLASIGYAKKDKPFYKNIKTREIVDLSTIKEIILSNIKPGTQLSFAERTGITPSYVSNIIKGHNMPSKKILASIGYEKVDTFERIKTNR